MSAPLSPDRLKQIRELFEELSELPVERREPFLESACREDPTLRDELESLLRNSGLADARFDKLEEDVLRPTLETLRGDPAKLRDHLSAWDCRDDNGPDPRIGNRIGHYEIEALAGRGGMGMVYRARDTILGRPVALKFLPGALNADASAKERFIHEAQTASALEHPNIATIFDIGETADNELYIAMAYYTGESLKERIGRATLASDTALDYAIQLAGALAVAHNHDVIHRDLKPGNILIAPTGSIKLLDFGLAKFRNSSPQTGIGQLTGTIAYMSPEQARGKAADPRSDIWALGVILHEMLTGERPFSGETTGSVIHAILESEPKALRRRESSLPAPMREIIARCLAKDPAERYQSADALLSDLKQVRQGEQPFEARQHAGRLQRRFRLKTAGATALAVVVVVITLPVWNRFQSNPVVPGEGIRSVAVLPFSDLSGNPGQAYFVDGIHDGTITALAQIGSLNVISRTSSMRYRDREQPLPEIARALGVEAVVDGTVQLASDRLRVSVQLIDARTDTHLWAHAYEREVSAANVFAIQNDICLAIANTLQAVLTPDQKHRIKRLPTDNLEALEAYYRARAARFLDSAEGRAEAVRHYQRAIELDPKFALAMAELASIHQMQIWLDGLSLPKQVEQAAPLIQKALSLNDQLGEAWVALGSLKWNRDGDFEGAREAYEKAVKLSPNFANAHLSLANLMMEAFGAPPEVLPHYEKAIALEPEVYGDRMVLWKPLHWMGRYEEAIAICEDNLRKDPNHADACRAMGFTLHYGTHHLDEAVYWYRKAHYLRPDNPFPPYRLSRVYERLGDYRRAAFWAGRSLAIRPESWMAHDMRTRIHLYKGDIEGALEYLAIVPRSATGFNHLTLRAVLQALLIEGQYETALDLCRQEYLPVLESPEFEMTGKEDGTALCVAAVLRANGLVEEADALIREVAEIAASQGHRYHSCLFHSLRLHALQGDREQLLEGIRCHLDGGCLTRIMFDSPEYDPYRDDPEFISLAAEVGAVLDRQLAHIRDMEAAGELAPLPHSLHGGTTFPDSHYSFPCGEISDVSSCNGPDAFGQTQARRVGPSLLSIAEWKGDYPRSKRSAFMTLVQAATKSLTNFSWLSSCA